MDEIYNLACPGSPVYSRLDPLNTIKTSIIGVMNMLELAKKLNIRILQASTSEIYGSLKNYPLLENDYGNVNPIGIRSCYEESKRCAETLAMTYFRQLK